MKLQASDILAILVVYGQSANQSSSWQSLQATEAGRQMRWLVFDNSPAPTTEPPAATHYEYHPENPGVSAAYLRGAALAAEMGCRWILLLDQDSRFPTDWFERYVQALETHPNATLLVPGVPAGNRWMSPAKYRWHRGWLNTPMPAGPFSLLQYAPINAGMLIQLDAYQACGGHEAQVQLDFSDFAFLHRFQKQNPTAVLAYFTLQHSLSGIEQAVFEQRLKRFGYYCRDAAAFARTGGPAGWLWFWALWRSMLLSLRYRQLHFFRVFWREFQTP